MAFVQYLIGSIGGLSAYIAIKDRVALEHIARKTAEQSRPRAYFYVYTNNLGSYTVLQCILLAHYIK